MAAAVDTASVFLRTIVSTVQMWRKGHWT